MRLHPFRALRPRPEVADQVAAVPYDVVNRAEAAELARGNPRSFLHVGRSDIDLPRGGGRLRPADLPAGAGGAGSVRPRGHAAAGRGAGALPLPADDGRPGAGRRGRLRPCGRLRARPDPQAREDPARQGGRPHPPRPRAQRERGAGVPHLSAAAGDRRAGGAGDGGRAALRLHRARRGAAHGLAGRRAGRPGPRVRRRCPMPTWPTGTTARPARGGRARSSGGRTPAIGATRSTTGSSPCSSPRRSSASCPTTGWCAT